MYAIYAFCFCASIELYVNKFTTQIKANIIACIIFQILFIINCVIIIHANNGNVDYKNNLQLLYGYFVYDTINLILNLENTELMYIFHHIFSLYILDYVITLLKLSNLYYATIIAFIGECQNPILNLKILVQDYPTLKKINKMLLYYLYFLFRIILFPVYSVLFLYNIEADFKLTLFFICIYTMSFNWFLNMRKKFKIKNLLY